MFRTMHKSDIGEAIKISDEVFGGGYLSNNHFDTRNESHVYYISKHANRISGFVIAYLANDSDKQHLFNSNKLVSDRTDYHLRCGKLGVIKTIAVSKSQQGNGIGNKLFFMAEKKLINIGAKEIIVPSWSAHGQLFLKNVLDRHGYKEIMKIPHMWADICGKSYNCLLREDSCCCEAIIFSKLLS